MLVTMTPQERPGNDRVAFTPDTRLSAPLLDACASGFPNSNAEQNKPKPGFREAFSGMIRRYHALLRQFPIPLHRKRARRTWRARPRLPSTRVQTVGSRSNDPVPCFIYVA